MNWADVFQSLALVALSINAISSSFRFGELGKRLATLEAQADALQKLAIKMVKFHLSELDEPTRDALVTEMDRMARAERSENGSR